MAATATAFHADVVICTYTLTRWELLARSIAADTADQFMGSGHRPCWHDG